MTIELSQPSMHLEAAVSLLFPEPGQSEPYPNYNHNSHLIISMIGIPPSTMTRIAVFTLMQSEFHPIP